MKLVIDISEELYEEAKETHDAMCDSVWLGIKYGTPLPKGHGRLIDADKTALLSDLFCYTRYTGIDEAPYEDATKALEFAPTIIEADGGDVE